MAKEQSYLNIMYKYAGKEVGIMFEHVTNSAVSVFMIEDVIDTTVNKFHNANGNLENIFNGKK